MTEDVGPSADGGGTNSVNDVKSGAGRAEPTVERTDLSQSEYLTKAQVAAFFQISESTVDNRINPESRWYCAEFPKPRLIGLGRCAALRWPRTELNAYGLSRPTKQFFPGRVEH